MLNFIQKNDILLHLQYNVNLRIIIFEYGLYKYLSIFRFAYVNKNAIIEGYLGKIVI